LETSLIVGNLDITAVIWLLILQDRVGQQHQAIVIVIHKKCIKAKHQLLVQHQHKVCVNAGLNVVAGQCHTEQADKVQ
jgi:anaerobic ribonucleoside-triphosphate reductase